jgi:hypothetical protein
VQPESGKALAAREVFLHTRVGQKHNGLQNFCLNYLFLQSCHVLYQMTKLFQVSHQRGGIEMYSV